MNEGLVRAWPVKAVLVLAVVIFAPGCRAPQPEATNTPTGPASEPHLRTDGIPAFTMLESQPVMALVEAGMPEHLARVLAVVPASMDEVWLWDRVSIREAVAPDLGPDLTHAQWEQLEGDINSAGHGGCAVWPSCDRRDAETFEGWRERYGFPLSALEVTGVIVDDSQWPPTDVVGAAVSADIVDEALRVDPTLGPHLQTVDIDNVGADAYAHSWTFECHSSRVTFPDRPRGCPGFLHVTDGLLVHSVEGGEAFADVLATGYGSRGQLVEDPGLFAALTATGVMEPAHLRVLKRIQSPGGSIPQDVQDARDELPSLPVPDGLLVVRDVDGTEHLSLWYDPDTPMEPLVQTLELLLTSDMRLDAGLPLRDTADLQVASEVPAVLTATIVGHYRPFTTLFDGSHPGFLLFG